MSAKDLDGESAAWLHRLGAGGGEGQAAERELHARLVRSRRRGRGRALPRVAAHLRACGPCAEDFAGLLAAVTSG